MNLTEHYTGIAIMTMRNGIAYSRECLKSLQAQTTQPLLILAVDNASTDGTAAWLRSEQQKASNLRRITFGEVVSVAAMWNTALRAAWEMGFEEALVVNSDTEFLPETHRTLSNYLLMHPDLGMVTAIGRREREQVVHSEGPFCPRPNPDYSAFMLRKSSHLKVPFDENCIGGYVEDLCHHLEMFRAGIDVACIDYAFFHHVSGTLKYADAKERRRIEFNADHNRRYFKDKYGCWPNALKSYEALFTSEAASAVIPASSSANSAEDLSAPPL